MKTSLGLKICPSDIKMSFQNISVNLRTFMSELPEGRAKAGEAGQFASIESFYGAKPFKKNLYFTS